jgi:hypothetical protein
VVERLVANVDTILADVRGIKGAVMKVRNEGVGGCCLEEGPSLP